MTDPSALNPDFRDMIEALHQAGAQFIVVGAYAMAVHGVPRATGDIDIFVEPTPANAERVMEALVSFGAPIETHRIDEQDLSTPGLVYQIGLPPRRIDILTAIDAIPFDRAWAGRIEIDLGGLYLPVLGRADLIDNKLATGHTKDLADVELLRSPPGTER